MLRYAQVNVDGQTLCYATEGNGPPLLLLHGPPFDHRMWSPTIPYLVGHFRVIAPDLAGFGRSVGAVGSGEPDAIIRMVGSLVTALQIVPCFVAGASFGGGIALGLAARHPERVRAVIGVGAMGVEYWPNTLQAKLAKLVYRVPGLLPLALRLSPRAHVQRFLRDAFREQIAVETVAIQVSNILSARPAQQMMIQILRHLNDWQFVMRQLGGIRAPTLLVWGEQDRIYGLKQAERLRHAIPNAQLTTVAGAGHLLSIERPIQLGEIMRRFLLPLVQSPPPGPRAPITTQGPNPS